MELRHQIAVTLSTFDACLAAIAKKRVLSLDTETTGLRYYHGDKPFSIIISDGTDAWYFNWNDRPDVPRDCILTDEHKLKLGLVLCRGWRLWYMHNVKFDLGQLKTWGLAVGGVIWDTAAVARLEYSDHPSYHLADCLGRIGMAKDDGPMREIEEQGYWEWAEIPGKRQREKLHHFDLVSWAVIFPYGCMDAHGTWHLGEHQRRILRELDKDCPPGRTPLRNCLKNEIRLTKTTFHMEQWGVQINPDYCECAGEFERGRMAGLVVRFQTLTGKIYEPKPSLYAELWGTHPKIGRTPPTKTRPEGSLCFDGDALDVLAQAGAVGASEVVQIRDAKSRLDYFNGFLYHYDPSGAIHTHLNQSGTKTGRFSSSKPNLQNLTKPDEDDEGPAEEFPVRRALVPRPGFMFAFFDMDQAEYRLLLDYANPKELVAKVLGGLDVHQATAELAKITRKFAKKANFATIYGSGIRNLAKELGVFEMVAKQIVAAIFEAAPEIKVLLSRIMQAAEDRGFVVNWLGRRWHLSEEDKAYRGPNAVIQGGVGDIVKVAMNRSDDHLQKGGYRSRLLLNVHDELVYEIHETELHLFKELHLILESSYPHKHLPLTWSVSHSTRSMADKIKGLPAGALAAVV